MGVCGSSGSGDTPHIMLAGLENSGKTFFLFKYLKNNFIENVSKQRTVSTTAFNFEMVDIAHYHVAIWDLPGRDSLRILWPNFYRAIEFSGVIFFIDYENKDKLAEACVVLHELLNEEELKNVGVFICFNFAKKDLEEDKNSKHDSVYSENENAEDKPPSKVDENLEEKLIKEMEKGIYFDKIPQLKKEIFHFDFFNESTQNSELNILRQKLKQFVDRFYL